MVLRMTHSWKYKTAKVTIDENSITVRALTQAERVKFSQQMKEDKLIAPALIVSMGALDPKLSLEDVGDAPGELVDAAMSKIMELTGFDKVAQKDAASGAAAEKKD